MRYSKVSSCGIFGIAGIKVEIEVSLLPGISSFEIVGLGDSAIREARNRVHAAIRNSGFDFPKGRIIVGMAPASIHKSGTSYDLPIAVGLLAASGQIKQLPSDTCIFGEMSLNGEIRGITGAVNRIIAAAEAGFEKIVLPYANLNECGIDNRIDIFGVKDLNESIAVIDSGKSPQTYSDKYENETNNFTKHRDISSIIGQSGAVYALQIAAAGWHNLMMTGSPGCGKTSIAEVLPGILPELDAEEWSQVAMIYSARGVMDKSIVRRERPFRSPHHSITSVAMTGGGGVPMPGEMSLAHKGILFLDEINEFKQEVLGNLKQPLEEQVIRISRQKYQIEFPADFILVAASNPCNCGNLLERDTKNPCRCSPQNIRRYLSALNGALADRIDIYVEMCKVPSELLEKSVSLASEIKSHEVRERITEAWKHQFDRCEKYGIRKNFNSRVRPSDIGKAFEFENGLLEYTGKAISKLELSVRSYQKMLRLARTIADYEGCEKVSSTHFAKALQFRRKI
ncbi:ATP-binding protein [Candidatus Nomurabacteria bacterium]|nr:ATP-binding protein [Candidatus Nomurabacteria bacterium]